MTGMTPEKIVELYATGISSAGIVGLRRGPRPGRPPPEPPEPPDVDVILAGDLWYEGPLAERVVPWLVRAAGRGTRILAGDPDRRYFPPAGFLELAAYEVHTTTAFDDRRVVTARVLTIDPSR